MIGPDNVERLDVAGLHRHLEAGATMPPALFVVCVLVLAVGAALVVRMWWEFAQARHDRPWSGDWLVSTTPLELDR